MIEGENKVLQAFLGTLMTWGLTAAGSALVFIFSTGRFSGKRKILDGSLGFAAGVMTAASFWSLLAPAIEMAKESGTYGEDGEYAWAPCAVGFALGGLFVLLSDMCLPCLTKKDPAIALALHARPQNPSKKNDEEMAETVSDNLADNEKSISIDEAAEAANVNVQILRSDSPLDIESARNDSQSERVSLVGGHSGASVNDSVELNVKQRRKVEGPSKVVLEYHIDSENDKKKEIEKEVAKWKSWKRMLLLIIAITVHNVPEGLAVGVAFGAIGKSASATFASARNLALGIGIQNFPEGMAVSVPLCAAGYSPLKSFWYGQLSGMVEPLSGVLGALAVTVASPLLPYALAFAAGAMIYVVVGEIIPEANMCNNGRIASWGCMVGFIVMMCLDVGLG